MAHPRIKAPNEAFAEVCQLLFPTFAARPWQYRFFVVTLPEIIIFAQTTGKHSSMTDNKSLIFIPSGGLANRMRAVASAYEMCRRTGVELRVVWFKDWALCAPFHEIFQPVDSLHVSDATPLDVLLYDRPRRRNLWIPRIFQNILFHQRIDEIRVTPLKCQEFDFDRWVTSKRKSWMSSYQDFGEFDNTVYRTIFRPADCIETAVRQFTSRFSEHTIGFHIRRTDNKESIDKSPVSLFIEAGKKEIALNPSTKIFLATDDEGVKKELTDIFGDKIMTTDKPADRSGTDGIRGGLTDMYTLSHTDTIYGSAGSSFSVMAAKIGGNRLVILER